MSSDLTDEEVIRQFNPEQSTQCFDTLYTRYVDKVYRQCLYLTQDSEQAQDFTHDIFIKVFDKWAGFQQRASFSTWIYTIAFNYCMDQLKRTKRLPTTVIDEQLEQHLPEPSESVRHEETMYWVKRGLESLSIEEQKLLRLKYEQGVSIDQIARLYTIKSSAVKMRLKRSRGKIQHFYARQQGNVHGLI